MITLGCALRLCDINKESDGVYLRNVRTKHSCWEDGHYFSQKTLRDKLDLKKIQVVKIDLCFEHFGPNFNGWVFVVDGISEDKLRKTALF